MNEGLDPSSLGVRHEVFETAAVCPIHCFVGRVASIQFVESGQIVEAVELGTFPLKFPS